MTENGGPSRSADEEEAAVPVSSLRNRWESLSQPGPAVPTHLAGRAQSRTASAPIRNDMPKTRVFPAARVDFDPDQPTSAAQSGAELAPDQSSLRSRVVSTLRACASQTRVLRPPLCLLSSRWSLGSSRRIPSLPAASLSLYRRHLSRPLRCVRLCWAARRQSPPLDSPQ
jgi:hypothetical protein